MAARKTAGRRAAAKERRRSCFIPTVEGTELKLNRFGAALGVLASGALVLSACGSDNNASWGKRNDRIVGGGERGLRREEDAEGQRVDGPGQCDDPLRQGVRTGLPGADVELHAPMARAPESANSTAIKPISVARTRRWPRTRPPRRSSAAARRRGTCRWCSARSRSPTTSTVVSSLNLDGPTAGEDLQRRHHHLERSRDQGTQRGRHPARRADSRRVPQRRVRDHG